MLVYNHLLQEWGIWGDGTHHGPTLVEVDGVRLQSGLLGRLIWVLSNQTSRE